MILFKNVQTLFRGIIQNISNIFKRTTENNQDRITEDNQLRQLENGS